jgi:phosphatidylglycerophosphate synthase
MTSGGSRRERGEQLTVLANRLTLTRFLLVVALAAVASLSPRLTALAAALVIAIWLTDVVDGPLARIGQRLGAAPRPEGQVIDPVVDDFAYAIGFVILLDRGLVPPAFVVLVVTTRCAFTLIRIVGLAQGRAFARPRRSGKLMGVCLGLGQIVIFSGAAGLAPGFDWESFREALVWLMSTSCAVALLDFSLVNREVIAAAVRQPRTKAPAPSVSQPRERVAASVSARTPLQSAVGRVPR